MPKDELTSLYRINTALSSISSAPSAPGFRPPLWIQTPDLPSWTNVPDLPYAWNQMSSLTYVDPGTRSAPLDLGSWPTHLLNHPKAQSTQGLQQQAHPWTPPDGKFRTSGWADWWGALPAKASLQILEEVSSNIQTLMKAIRITNNQGNITQQKEQNISK